MYFVVPADQQSRLDSEVRRKRLISSLVWYVPCVAIFTGIAVLYFVTRGYHFVRAIVHAFDGKFTEAQIIGVLAIISLVVVAVAVALLLRSILRERLYERHLFCPACRAVDKDDEGACPCCGSPLSRQECFFITHFDDEIRLAQRIGLLEATEA